MTPAKDHRFANDVDVMQRALLVARMGCGHVEPNPMVGAVVVDDQNRFVAEGYHTKFGMPHAEVEAISAAGSQTAGAVLFVTLEPCSHQGKTPPCADAVINAGFRRVVIGCQDPAPHVAGAGIARLKAAGIEVDVGVCQTDAEALIAPFKKLMLTGRPWVHAKWAMTLDGKIASRTGHSKWITCDESRAAVHQLRGRMDVIVTGAGTVRADDPQLTVRPPGPRSPLRVVVDEDGTSVQTDSNLVNTISDAPLMVCVSKRYAATDHIKGLQQSGVEILLFDSNERAERLSQLLDELGHRKLTNALVESGGGLMGAFFDAGLVDEVHAFVAPKIVGGAEALSPVGGTGQETIPNLDSLQSTSVTRYGNDLLIEGRVMNSSTQR